MKEASFAELFVAHQKSLLRRNVALVVGFVAMVAIVAAGWSRWALIIPALIWLGASGQHFNLKLVEHEMKQRKKAAKE